MVREWRKIYSSILDSDDVSKMSDGAMCLLTMLIVAQDDSGAYPWLPTKIKALTATRQWTTNQATKYRDEIVSAGIGYVEGDFIVLKHGAERNGQRQAGRKPWLYSGNRVVTMGVPSGNQVVSIEEKRVEERREERREDACLPSGNQVVTNFDVFWKAYPNKKGKADAVKAFNKLKLKDGLFETIMSAIENAKASKEWAKNDGEFIPHPASWLNKRRWEDELTPKGGNNRGSICEGWDTYRLDEEAEVRAHLGLPPEPPDARDMEPKREA